MCAIELQQIIIEKLSACAWEKRTLLVEGLCFDLTRYKGTKFPRYWYKLIDRDNNVKLIPYFNYKNKIPVVYLEYRLLMSGDEISKKINNKVLLAMNINKSGLMLWYTHPFNKGMKKFIVN